MFACCFDLVVVTDRYFFSCSWINSKNRHNYSTVTLLDLSSHSLSLSSTTSITMQQITHATHIKQPDHPPFHYPEPSAKSCIPSARFAGTKSSPNCSTMKTNNWIPCWMPSGHGIGQRRHPWNGRRLYMSTWSGKRDM